MAPIYSGKIARNDALPSDFKSNEFLSLLNDCPKSGKLELGNGGLIWNLLDGNVQSLEAGGAMIYFDEMSAPNWDKVLQILKERETL